LLALQDKAKLWSDVLAVRESGCGSVNCVLDLFGLMANDRKNGFRSQFEGGTQNMCDQRKACEFVQNLCSPRLHAGAQTGCQDHYIRHKLQLAEYSVENTACGRRGSPADIDSTLT